MSKPKRTTIVFPTRDKTVLLGLKKRGFGSGWFNGYGGKAEKGESFEDCAVRETLEESGLHVAALKPVARLLFRFDGVLEVVSAAYATDSFTGQLRESDEMSPHWFLTEQLPYTDMWPGDRLWVPQALVGCEPINLEIRFSRTKRLLGHSTMSDSCAREYVDI